MQFFRIILALALLLLSVGAGAVPVEEWNRIFGVRIVDVAPPFREEYSAFSAQQTLDGGYIVLGSSVLTPSESYGISWLFKTDKDGNEQWNKSITSTVVMLVSSIQQTTDSGYILTGSGGWNADAGWNEEPFLIKTDSNGNEWWNRTFRTFAGIKYYDRINTVKQTSDDGYILAGFISSYRAGGDVEWADYARIIKTDPDGNEQWNRTFVGKYSSNFYFVQQTSDGGYILSGYKSEYNGVDAWLVKADSKGNKQWERVFDDDDVFIWVNQTSDGGYVLASDSVLVRTDSNGSRQWSKTFMKKRGIMVRSIQQTFDGGYIFAGGTNEADALLLKTDSNGNEQWNMTFGEKGKDDLINSIQQTRDGGYILAGYTESYGSEGKNAWLIKVKDTQDIEKPGQKFIPSFELCETWWEII